MRLYLSSYRFGNHPEELIKLVSANKHAGIILNAGDSATPEELNIRFIKQSENLESLGFTSEEIDLRKYFGKLDELNKLMSRFGLVWVQGGNIFFLKRAFEQSGFDIIIKEMLLRDKLVYAGYSAGAVIVGPSLEGLDIVDDIKEVPMGYSPEFSMDGLNLVKYMIAPHYKSPHPESLAVDKLVEYFEHNNINYKTLKDGEVLIISGDNEKIIS